MAALTKDTTVTSPPVGSGPLLHFHELPVKADAVIFKGALVAVDSTGYLVAASTATGLRAAGRAEESANNTGGASGAKRVRVARGVFPANNATSTDAIVQADLLATVYFLDDNTLTHTSTGRSAAGKFVGFSDDGRPQVEIY
jgi:hypothetical protein